VSSHTCVLGSSFLPLKRDPFGMTNPPGVMGREKAECIAFRLLSPLLPQRFHVIPSDSEESPDTFPILFISFRTIARNLQTLSAILFISFRTIARNLLTLSSILFISFRAIARNLLTLSSILFISFRTIARNPLTFPLFFLFYSGR
jgi:hypothetical protein